MSLRIIAVLLPLLSVLPAQAEDTSQCFKAIYQLKEGSVEQAIALYSECIANGELSKRNLIVAYNDRGNAYGKAGRFDEALADFERVIELDPDDADAWYNHGLTLKQLSRLDDALVDYSRAIELNPRYARAFNNRGSIHGHKGEYRRAIEDFDRAIDIDPGEASAWFNRGLAWQALGNWPRAASDLERAVELDPDYARAFERLAWLRATAPDPAVRDGVLAVMLARKARLLSPGGTPLLYDVLAAAYATRGSFEEAVRYQELALEILDDAALERYFRHRLDLYRGGRAFEASDDDWAGHDPFAG